jgi:hypothetical protein
MHFLVNAERRKNKSSATDSSLFMDYAVSETFISTGERFASPFMGILACNVMKSVENSVMQKLKDLFGSSGMGHAFEYDAHMSITDSARKRTFYCSDTDGECWVLPFGVRKRVFIRSIEDIRHLKKGDYGLPIIPNFPLVDAVIPPNIVLQMTTSQQHKGSVDALESIAASLEVPIDKLNMVYIVPADKVESFIFSSNAQMCRTRQLVTAAEKVVSMGAFKKLIAQPDDKPASNVAFKELIAQRDDKPASKRRKLV